MGATREGATSGQVWTKLSPCPETSTRPSRLNASDRVPFECERSENARVTLPLITSQKRMTSSCPPVAKLLSSGLTASAQSSPPGSVRVDHLAAADELNQSRTVRSSPTLASV